MTATTEHVPAGTVLQVDPTTLVLDDNIRTEVRLDDGFVDSIAERDVMVPLHVRQDPLGQLLVVDGQRRLTAALQLALATVPVVVVAGIGDDESRITDQWILNEHRAGLTQAERVAAVEQLALFGRSPAAIAKKLGTSEAEVDAARALAKAPTVLATAPTMDLVTAAKLTEFADDEALVDELAVASQDEPDYFEHRLEKARQDRAVEQARADRVAQLREAGVAVADPGAGSFLARLSATPSDGNTAAPAITPEEHADCPHRAMRVDAFWNQGVYVDVDELCLDREAAGHFDRFDYSAGVDAEAAAAAKSAERKHTIAQNAATDAAQEVRRRFITDHLLWERDPKGRMTKVPDGVVQHVAVVIAMSGTGQDFEVGNLLREWEDGKTIPLPGSSRPAAERALLRRVLANGEVALPRSFWRSNHWVGHYMPHGAPLGVLHLRQLAAWGYGLAPIEQEYLEGWDAAVVDHHERQAKLAAEHAVAAAAESPTASLDDLAEDEA